MPASFWQPRYGKREENLLLTSFSFALPDSSIAATTTTTTTRVPDQAARKIKRRTYTTGEDIYTYIKKERKRNRDRKEKEKTVTTWVLGLADDFFMTAA